MFYVGSILICAGIIADQHYNQDGISEITLALCASITITCLWKIVQILAKLARKKIEESQ